MKKILIIVFFIFLSLPAIPASIEMDDFLPMLAKTWIAEAEKLEYAGDYNSALSAYMNAKVYNPINWESYYGIAKCLDNQKKYQDAITYYSETIDKYTNSYNNLNYYLLARFYLQRAVCYLQLHSFQRCLDDIELVEKYYPKDGRNMHSDIYYTKAMAKAGLGNYSEAIKSMKMAKLYLDKSKDKEELQTYDRIISIFKTRVDTN